MSLHRTRKIVLAVCLLAAFAPSGVSGQVFRVFAGWDLGDPCLGELINDYGIPQEINTSDAAQFSATSSALKRWAAELFIEASFARDEFAKAQKAGSLTNAQVKEMQGEAAAWVDCITRVGRIVDRLEQQLEDLGIDTLTVGSDRHGIQRRAFFAELDQTLEDAQRACGDILGFGKQPAPTAVP